MKFYKLDTEFTFGMFEGKTVREILDLQLTYIDWCAVNLDHFYMTESVIQEIRAIKPGFALSEEGKQSLNEKYSIWNEKQDEPEEDCDSYHFGDNDYQYDMEQTFLTMTDGNYGNYRDYDDE